MHSERLQALRALQHHATPAEAELISAPIVESQELDGGVNRIHHLRLETGQRAYFKPLAGVCASFARDFGHSPEATLLNECAAWQLAKALGPPYDQLVAVCVWRELEGI